MNLDMPEHATWIEAVSALRGRSQRKIGNNTWLVRRPGDTGSEGVYVTYHGHMIAEWERGKLTVSSCGYHTKTTKERMNYFLPRRYYVAQRDYTWYLFDRHNDHARSDFFDGMVFDNA